MTARVPEHLVERVPACVAWVALIAAWALPSCDGSTPTAEGARPPLVVGVSTLRISLPVFVASDRGLFERHGAVVELRSFDTAQPLVEEVLDGRLDAGGYAALPIVLAAAGHAGRGVRVATGIVEDDEHPVSVLIRRAGDATLTSVADLRGRRVGVLPTIAYTTWLSRVLQHAGVEPAAVTVVPIAPALQVSTLAEGGVDALFTNDPMATSALVAGAGELFGPRAPVSDALGDAHVFGAFIVAEDVARERPADVAALLVALDEAIAYIRREPTLAADAMAAFLRESERSNVRRYPTASYLTSAELDGARLGAEARRAHELGLVVGVPDVSGWSLAGAAP